MLSLFAAAPAEAQSPIWSATLSTQSSTQYQPLSSDRIFGCANGFAHTAACTDTTKLTDDDFTHGGTTYTITALVLAQDDDGDDNFVLRHSGLTGTAAKTALTGLALNVGTATYVIADATASGNLLTWTSSLGWTTDTQPPTVSVSLTPWVPPTEDATLSALTASTGTSATGAFSALTLTPSTFSASTTAYTATVPGTATHLKITPTVNNASATVKVGKGSSLATVSSGSPSAAIPLSLGSNAITVEVTAADGTTTKTYTVTVSRVNVPAAPTNLRVSVRSQQLNLSWTAPSGTLTGYDVHYTSANAATAADSAAVQTGAASAGWVAVSRGMENTPPTASQNITGLTNGTAYRVRVRATNAVGDGVWAFGSGSPSLPALSLSASPNPVVEGTSVTVTATRSQPLSSAVSIPVTVSTAAPNSAESGDIGTLTSITIAAGQVSGTGTIATNHDTGDNDEDETFTVSLGTLPSGYVAGSPSSVQVTILDDEGRPRVSISATPNPVAEGGSVTLTATVSEALPDGLTVPLTLTPGTAEAGDYDIDVSPPHITIPRGGSSATETITIHQDADPDDETFTVSIGRLPTMEVLLGAESSVEITIEDDETAVSLSASPNPVAEGSPVTVTATLSAALTSAVTVPLSLTRGTAEAGDYGSLSSITIAGGATSATGTVSTNQDADNDDETFTVSLGNLPSRLGSGDPASVEIAIDDDEVPSVSLSADPVLEGESGTVTVRLSSVLASPVTIPLTVTAGTAEGGDYTAPSSVTVPAGSSTATGTIQTNQDTDSDDETLTVALGTLPSSVTSGTPSSIVVTIVDDENRPTVSLSASATEVSEGGAVVVTATLSEALTVAVTIPLRYGISGEDEPEDSAESGDYRTPAGILIAAGQTVGRVNIGTVEDADGFNERFTVSLDTDNLPPHVLAGSPASVAIVIRDGYETDTGRAAVTLRALRTTVDEGDAAEFILLLSRPAPAASDGVENDILVRVTGNTTEHTPDEYEDVGQGTVLVRVPAGATSATFTVQTYRDTDADDERFTVSLEEDDQYGWMSWLTIGSPSSVQITIRDGATPPPDTGSGSGSGTGTKSVYASLSAKSFTVEEGSSAEITVVLSGPAPVNSWEEITVPVNITRGTAEPGDVQEGVRYQRIGGGRTLSLFFVSTSIDDDTDDETFTVSLGAMPDGLTAGSPSSLTITIKDVVAGLPGWPGGYTPTALGGSSAAAFAVAENHAEGAAVGRLAGWRDGGDGRTLSLSSPGADHEAFAIDANGTLRVAEGVMLDYERQAEYAFNVTAGDANRGNGGTASAANRTLEVTVSVQNVEEPPGAPAGLSAAGAGPDRIEVSWTAPQDTGARLDGYEVQYKPEDAAQWTDRSHEGTATSTAIGGLAARSAYEVRVRSLGDGKSDWEAVTATTTVAAPALTGALPDLTLVAGNPDFVVDASAAITGEELTFSFASSDPGVASFAGDSAETANGGSTAQLRAESAGDARITVTATNPGGAASVTFSVTVKSVSDEEAEALALSADGLTRSLLSGATGVIGARMAASDTEAQALPRLEDIDAMATIAGLLGLPAPAGPAVGSSPAGSSMAAGGGLASSHSGPAGAWAGTGLGAGSGHGSARPGETFPGNGMPQGNGMPPGNGLDAGGGEASGGNRMPLRGNLWNRSFAFSLAPGGGQATDGAPSSRRAPAPPGGAPAHGRAPAPLSGLTVWGLGDVQNFSGGEGASRFDGEWHTAYLGADRRFGERWLGGVALSHGRGDADYTYAGQNPGAGRLGTDLTAVYPYVKGVLGGGTELWAMLGAGTGEATLQRDRAEGENHRGDLGMRLGAAGLRHALADFDAVRISVLADIGTATLDIDGEAALAALDSVAHRARAGVEVAGTGRFSPYVRLNARYDGGHNLAEAGYESEAGLRYAGSRVDFELRGRWMGLAGGTEYVESGATATLTVKAAPDGTGLTATLTPSWGQPGTANFVWGQGAMPTMNPRTGADPGMMLNAEVGYGIESWRLRGLLTPTLGYGRSGPAGDALRFGAGYAAKPEWLRRELSIGLGLQRHRTLDGPDWGMELRTQMRW